MGNSLNVHEIDEVCEIEFTKDKFEHLDHVDLVLVDSLFPRMVHYNFLGQLFSI